MEHVRWADEPTLRRPIVIAAFEGWNDAGDAATTAATVPAGPLGRTAVLPRSTPRTSTTSPRPAAGVRLDDDGQREILWPENQFWHGVGGRSRRRARSSASSPSSGGAPTASRWSAWLGGLSAPLVVTLGAPLAEVPHTARRPGGGHGRGRGAHRQRLSLRRSSYEGPTGIVGVLHDACRRAGLGRPRCWGQRCPPTCPARRHRRRHWPWSNGRPSLLDVPVETTDLEIAASSYERQVNEVVDVRRRAARVRGPARGALRRGGRRAIAVRPSSRRSSASSASSATEPRPGGRARAARACGGSTPQVGDRPRRAVRRAGRRLRQRLAGVAARRRPGRHHARVAAPPGRRLSRGRRRSTPTTCSRRSALALAPASEPPPRRSRRCGTGSRRSPPTATRSSRPRWPPPSPTRSASPPDAAGLVDHDAHRRRRGSAPAAPISIVDALLDQLAR